VNREATPIEAIYVFPLDEGAAVCGFEAIVDGTLVIGEVKEREEAFRLYDEAMERGDGAFLLDEERPDVFQASVGNLPPGKEVLLKLVYVSELTVEGSALRFSIPTTVSPRYAPPEDRVGVGRPDAQTLNPPAAWSVPYGLTLSVRLAMPGPITRVESTSHPIAVTMNGPEATVTLSHRDQALDRDFVLAVDAAGLDAPKAIIEREDDGRQALSVLFVPQLGESRSPAEVIFLIDRSGSMQGTSIQEVRNALQLCLRSMIPGCCFNIVGFGSTFQTLFSDSQPYDEQSLAGASAHVTEMQADLGGTEILEALRFVLTRPRHATLPRQVVVVTDGQVTNTDAVLSLGRGHASEARIFTFGIGAGSSHHLVNGLARVGGGSAEFIYPGERIEPKIVRQFGRLLSPALTDLRMDWGGLKVTQAPTVVPPIFAGGRLVLYGFLKDAQPTTVRLTARGPSGPLAFDLAVDPACSTAGRTVATLAARTRIRELEEGPDWVSARGSRQRERKESVASREIIELSMRYGLISRETSFVAVERRKTPVEGAVQLRRVPIALTTGWGNVIAGDMYARLRRSGIAFKLPSPEQPTMAFHAGVPVERELPTALMAERGARIVSRLADWAGAARARAGSRAKPRPEPRTGTSLAGASDLSRRVEDPVATAMHALIVLQRADGSWDLTRKFASAIGQVLSNLETPRTGTASDREEKRRAWATALALAWLQDHASGYIDEWRLLAEKARTWLERVAALPLDGSTWIDAARRFLRA
jgi:Ca-activated chloride channel family protein